MSDLEKEKKREQSGSENEENEEKPPTKRKRRKRHTSESSSTDSSSDEESYDDEKESQKRTKKRNSEKDDQSTELPKHLQNAALAATIKIKKPTQDESSDIDLDKNWESVWENFTNAEEGINKLIETGNKYHIKKLNKKNFKILNDTLDSFDVNEKIPLQEALCDNKKKRKKIRDLFRIILLKEKNSEHQDKKLIRSFETFLKLAPVVDNKREYQHFTKKYTHLIKSSLERIRQ